MAEYPRPLWVHVKRLTCLLTGTNTGSDSTDAKKDPGTKFPHLCRPATMAPPQSLIPPHMRHHQRNSIAQKQNSRSCSSRAPPGTGLPEEPRGLSSQVLHMTGQDRCISVCILCSCTHQTASRRLGRHSRRLLEVGRVGGDEEVDAVGEAAVGAVGHALEHQPPAPPRDVGIAAGHERAPVHLPLVLRRRPEQCLEHAPVVAQRPVTCTLDSEWLPWTSTTSWSFRALAASDNGCYAAVCRPEFTGKGPPATLAVLSKGNLNPDNFLGRTCEATRGARVHPDVA